MKKDKTLSQGITEDMSEEEKKDKLLSNFKKWGKENRRWISKIPRNIIKKIMGRLD